MHGVNKVLSVKVEGFSVILKLADGTSIERDFSLCRDGALARLHRSNGLDPRVRIEHGALSWPKGIDFELDLILRGWPRRNGRILKRALVGCGGSLIPAPLVSRL